MEEGTFKHLIISGILITLFVVMALNFSVEIADEYDLNESDVIDPRMYKGNFTRLLPEAQNQSEEWQSNFTSKVEPSAGEYLGIGAILEVTKLAYNFIITPFTLLNYLISGVLGVPTPVSYVIIFILVITFLLSMWRLYKQGS